MNQPERPLTRGQPAADPNQYDPALTVSSEPSCSTIAPSSLYRDQSFWSITATQFLGAFNDNVYKQLLLLIFVAIPVGGATKDRQWIALLMFSLPFVLFSGFAGFLSDRFSKARLILACKIAEVVIMGLGVGGFMALARWGTGSWVQASLCGILFCMGTHSAFFGPGKYGALPELFRERDLPAANGVVLMTTFLAIILGSALAGFLMHWWSHALWRAGMVCVGVAVLGVGTAWGIRYRPPAAAGLKFEPGVLFIPREIRQLLGTDRPLRAALVASTVFWLAAAIVQPAVNALGKRQLLVDDRWTSLLVTIISLGIAVGCALAGYLSAGRVHPTVQRVGAWGMFVTLSLLAVRGGPRDHLLGYRGSLVVLVLLGIFTGLFAVPLQVFLQSRPPPRDKGRMIATQNLLNWIGIFLSSGIYFAADYVLRIAGWPNNGVFALTALLMLPVALWYRPPGSAAGERPGERPV